MNEIRQAVAYGIRPTRTFEQAAVKYLNDYQHKKSASRTYTITHEITVI